MMSLWKNQLFSLQKIPTLLVNGSSGIAVGMATNIPPHNLGEIIDAIEALIDNADVTIDELMTYVKGPGLSNRSSHCRDSRDRPGL